MPKAVSRAAALEPSAKICPSNFTPASHKVGPSAGLLSCCTILAKVVDSGVACTGVKDCRALITLPNNPIGRQDSKVGGIALARAFIGTFPGCWPGNEGSSRSKREFCGSASIETHSGGCRAVLLALCGLRSCHDG